MYRRILTVNDGSPGAARALDAAFKLASLFGAALYMIMTEELPLFPITMGEVDAEKLAADQRFTLQAEAALRRAVHAQVEFHSQVVVGRLIERAMDCINHDHIDLLVLADLRRSPILEFIFGDTTERLRRAAPCPTHLVK
jgi:nucleotide-binding universal stress UspA family protein